MDKKILRTLAVLTVGFGQFAFSQEGRADSACAAYAAIAKSFVAEVPKFPVLTQKFYHFFETCTKQFSFKQCCANTQTFVYFATKLCEKGADKTDADHLAYIVDGPTYLKMCSKCVSELIQSASLGSCVRGTALD